jgi:hypothetical protein
MDAFASPELLKMGFDRYQRFRAVAEIITKIADGHSLDILDVGGFDASLTRFVSKHRVSQYSQHITPGAPLALADDSVDLVCALDVLEHVPLDGREFFISEVSRVAKRAAILAFPIKQAEEAERFVLSLTKSPWLAEHQEHGLPDPAKVKQTLRGLGLEFERHANACLPSWTAMMLLMYGVDAKTREDISAFFNRHYYRLENREPAYRYIYVCRKAQ